MSKLDSKKIASSLKSLENAAKGAVRALNEMTDNQFSESSFEKEPLANVGFIMNTLRMAAEQAEKNAKFDGLDEDGVAELLATEREAERVALQEAVQAKLAKRVPEPVEDTEEVAEEVTDEAKTGDEKKPETDSDPEAGTPS